MKEVARTHSRIPKLGSVRDAFHLGGLRETDAIRNEKNKAEDAREERAFVYVHAWREPGVSLLISKSCDRMRRNRLEMSQLDSPKKRAAHHLRSRLHSRRLKCGTKGPLKKKKAKNVSVEKKQSL
jgi:hypothetical protein